MCIRDSFCYVGSEFPVQVGGRDFALDLLFFHRGLNALVAFELKVNEFEPEYLGKLNFYLEALDRDVRKEHEQPSIGVLLCASKNDEIVEYALSRSLSPALIEMCIRDSRSTASGSVRMTTAAFINSCCALVGGANFLASCFIMGNSPT